MTFYSLAKLNELVEGFKRSVKLPSLTVVIFVLEDETYIIEDRCPHMDVPLATGTLETSGDNEAAIIRCRAHGIGFSLANGEPEGMWADTLKPLKVFEPVYRDYSVGIEIVS